MEGSTNGESTTQNVQIKGLGEVLALRHCQQQQEERSVFAEGSRGPANQKCTALSGGDCHQASGISRLAKVGGFNFRAMAWYPRIARHATRCHSLTVNKPFGSRFWQADKVQVSTEP